jgi:hypothetical protein
MDTTATAVSNGNARAFLDSLAPGQTYTVTATCADGVTAAELVQSGQTLAIGYGGDQVDLFMYGTDAEATAALEWAVGELATGYLRSGHLVEVTTPDGRLVTA